MTEAELTELIRKFLSGKANEEERKMVEEWYESFDNSAAEIKMDVKDKADSKQRGLEVIKEKIAGSERQILQLSSRKRMYRWVAAAVVLILVAGSVYFVTQLSKDRRTLAKTVNRETGEIQPGGNKAVLTLGNGQQIVLDSSNNGLLSVQGGMNVVKLNNGSLSYSPKNRGSHEQNESNQKGEVLYNTITTPRGGQYQIVLSDGSRVWLNAASSISFPTAFKGDKREVTITGEIYFEVKSDAQKPFIVKNGDVEIKVLGTRFNVMAYEGEDMMKTTLLEGSIKVSAKDVPWQPVVVHPGEQVQINNKRKIKLIKDGNVNRAIAWKNELFWFEDDDIHAVIQQLSRWYNIDIKTKGKIPDLFTGSIPRNLTFSRFFEILQKTGSIRY